MQRMTILFLAALAMHAEARATPPKEAKKAAVALINPKLEDVSSDKKFFGPPFPADYPSDARPTMQPDILKELKENNKPYPYLQNRDEYDKDYVKDENDDKGMWKAQFDYDAYRKLIGEEEWRVKQAQENADKEGRDESDAQKGVDDADKAAKDAEKDTHGDKDDDKDDGAGGDGLSDAEKKKLDDLEKKVKDAQDAYDKAKKEFEECQRQLEAAEKEVEDAKKELKDYEDYVFSQQKLFALKNEADAKVRQTKKEATAAAVKLAQAKLDVANEVKKEKAEVAAKEKAEHEAAEKVLQEKIERMEKVKQEMEKARLHLSKLRGYKEPAVTKSLTKSGAVTPRGISAVLLLVLACMGVQTL